MNIQRATPLNEFLAKLIFLLLPTAVLGYFLLWHINQYYSILNAQGYTQSIYLGAGMLIASFFYGFRFRFLPTFALLIFILFSIYKGLDKLSVNEFDAFFISVQFWVFAFLFTGGWLIGWMFIRLRYSAVFIATGILAGSILLIAKSQIDSVRHLIELFAPALLYSVYLIFTAEQIYGYKDKSKKFWWFLSRRLISFALLACLLFGAVYWFLRKEIKETVANYGGGGKAGKNSMLKQNQDGSFDLNEFSQLRGSLGRDKQLLFCAHIDNFFPGTQVPNPLYLTSFYYTKFDTLTETFEKDSTLPLNDLFEPDPSKIPLFSMKSDSGVLRNSLASRFRKTVDIEIYTKLLSPSTYLAPHTGFFVQPVTVEKDFREEYKTAYRAKGWVSELNSAYFIYNVPKGEIRKFQEQRFEVLRRYSDYSQTDKAFIKYYTYMPADAKFRSISDLAHKVADSAHSTADKILAIRDYFLSKDENGDPLYHYTDNPGVPDIPSASKLLYFLNQNHKGYCAYFAGATLFMLRSLGIPSRIAVGFLTVDRSDKNKGWYWYYADQAHAWVQVYFPEIGWIDFDTTVGNSDAQESPKPDGTPPLQAPKAWLAATGIIQDVDTARKTMKMKLKQVIFHDKEYKFKDDADLLLDLKIAELKRDSLDVPISNLQAGEEATAVSYAEVMKKMEVLENEKGKALINRLPIPAPIDEVYLKIKEVKAKEAPIAPIAKNQRLSYKQILRISVGILAALLLLMFLLPELIFRGYLWRHKRSKTQSKRAYWAYRAALYYVNQLGYERKELTPMEYARQCIDPSLRTSFANFMPLYLKIKYSKEALNENETLAVESFLSNFLHTVNKNIKFKKRLFSFLNPLRTISFYVSSDK
jgi:transglutaminase-like putative cysteine protease